MVSQYRWEFVTDKAAWAGRDGAGALIFKNRMWLLGGWNPRDRKNFPRTSNSEVWSSQDGLNWELELPQAPWEGRHTAGYAVHGGKMWIVGGDVNQGHYQNDVWSSTDGVKWELVNSNVQWGPRALHCTASFKSELWIMGGQTMPGFVENGQVGLHDRFYRDIWKSSDGSQWTMVTKNAPWSKKGMVGGSVVLNCKLWLLGGGTYDTPTTPDRTFSNEVWNTSDGITWESISNSPPWMARQYHDVAVFDEKMWVLGGFGNNHINLNDVWYSPDGKNWTELPDTPWTERHASSVFVFDKCLWVMAGNNAWPMVSDVWKLTKI